MTKGYFEFEYLKRRDLNDEVQKVVQIIFNTYNSVAGTVDYFANLPSASANLNKIWLVRFATTFLGIITKQAGLYISDGTNWNWMTSLEAKADKNILISAGNGLTGGGDLSANRTISHSDTSSQVNVVNTGGNVIQSANLDDFGHITSFSSIDLDNRYITTSGAYANPTWITSLGADKLTGTIPSNVLSGSTVYIGTTAIALNRASGNQALTGISSVQFAGATSGTATIQAPAIAGTTTFTLPATSGNLITDQQYTANDVLQKIKTVDGTGSGLDADTLEGIPLGTTAGNNGVEWPSVLFIKSAGIIEAGRYIDFHASSLEAQDYTARIDAGSATTARVLTLPSQTGTLISSGGSSVVSNTMLAGSITDNKLNTITTAGKVANSATTATNLNTINTIVSRDASGNFSAGTITASLSGNSTTATTLQTARTINGVSFNGSADITITANTPNILTIASPLTGGSFDGSSAISIGLSNSGVIAGTYQSATTITPLTIDAKGIVTSVGAVATITPAFSSITNTPTTIAGYGITDGVTLNGTETLTNKTFTDNTTFFQDNLDNTKKAQFDLSSITTVTTRTYTLPNDNGKIVITNSGNTQNIIPKFNNDDKLIASNITDDGSLINVGPFAVFDIAGTTSISYLSSFAIGVYPTIGLNIGNFAEADFYGAINQPSLFSNDTTSQSVIVVNPKIPYCVNGTNNYTGSKTGANITFASNTTATNNWDIGVGANAVGVDIFSIGRNGTSLFTMSNAGAITTNINTTAQITTTQANNTGTGLGQIYLNGATGNRIDFNSNGTAAPIFTTRSAGTKIVLQPHLSGTAMDYAIGVEGTGMWLSVRGVANFVRFYAGVTVISRIGNDGIQTRGQLYQGNAAFTALNTTATLTIAQILTLVIESTPTANITFTLPTGTNTDAGVMSSLETFASFTWSIVNIATGFTITMAGNTGNTYIGNTTIAANTSATFRTQKTAANTFKTVRI